MTHELSPQERVAATRRLYAVIMSYLERANWTPLEGALIMSGIHPHDGCTRIPTKNWIGLDGVQQHGDIIGARRILDEWASCSKEAQVAGVATPKVLPPFEFVMWCLGSGLETDWIHHFQNLVRCREPGEIDVIPLDIIEYTTQATRAVNSVLGRLRPGPADARVPSARASEPVATDKPIARSPMPIPINHENLSPMRLLLYLQSSRSRSARPTVRTVTIKVSDRPSFQTAA